MGAVFPYGSPGATEVLEPQPPFIKRVMKWVLRNKLAAVGLFVILVLYTAGILAPWVSPHSYLEQNLSETNQGPSVEHFFGTDKLGRDLFTRVLWSLRTTVYVTGIVILTGGLFIGVSLGLAAGYLRGMTDTIIMRVGEMFALIPGLLLLILISATIRPRYEEIARPLNENEILKLIFGEATSDLFLIFGVLSLFFWYGTARIIRSQVLRIREEDYVLAARSMGASVPRILFRHILPNLSGIIIVGVSSGLGAIAGSEIALTFLGLGVQPPHPSFGALIYDSVSIRTFQAYPHLLLFPGITVALLMYAFNLVGDAFTSMVNPKTSAR